jgi:hypothetical protein
MDLVVQLFINTKILTRSLISPQTPIRYLQEVFVPEATVRLIQEDCQGIQIACEIILQSVNLGRSFIVIGFYDFK